MKAKRNKIKYIQKKVTEFFYDIIGPHSLYTVKTITEDKRKSIAKQV